MADTEELQFIESLTPALAPGSYTIEMKQTLGLRDIQKELPAKQSTFHLFGPRFTLNPQDIYAVFPPAGSLGDHGDVLPHIILVNDTLPWERNAFVGVNPTAPWLALLVFDEDKAPPPQILTLREAGYVHGDLESGQHLEDQVTVIDVPQELLPSASELRLLAHVRQRASERRSVVIANRLPKSDRASIVHLVSVEGHYVQDTFDDAGATSIQLVSLKSWRFACLDPKQSFSQLLANLDHRFSSLRLRETGDSTADAYLEQGYVPLAHGLRQGSMTVSWYHGPLAPGATHGELDLPVRSADDLLIYHAENGLFDASYAAAWELGRLLTLQNGRAATAIAHWKLAYRCCLHVHGAEASIYGHLPFKPIPPDDSAPGPVFAWFRQLANLEVIPFNYLVPAEAMLPSESIRFFQVDPLWIDALLDGAFSIGRITQSDFEQDCDHCEADADHPAVRDLANQPTITGFLLRSEVVSGWPGLIVDGYDHVLESEAVVPEDQKMELLRMARLSPNVLLCLFAGEVRSVDFHLRPEALHFGVNVADSPPWKDQDLRVLDINSLAASEGAGNSAELAAKLIAVGPKVRVTWGQQGAAL